MLTLKKTLPALAVILAFAAHSVTAAELKTSEERESYSMGASVANYIAAQIMKQEALGVKTDKKLVLQGFNDALQNKSKISVDDIIKELNKRQDVLSKLEEKAVEKARAKNAADGKAYLEKNAKKKGVVTTESGLQYEVLKQGKGALPTTADVVTVNYEGRLIDGTVFDSTAQRGPQRFVVMSVVPGFEEGLKLMKEGSKYRFVMPAKLAYGSDGIAQIPPESTLIFEVELLKVEKVKGHQGMMKGMGMSGM